MGIVSRKRLAFETNTHAIGVAADRERILRQRMRFEFRGFGASEGSARIRDGEAVCDHSLGADHDEMRRAPIFFCGNWEPSGS